MSETLAVVRLKKGEERRLRAGHMWVYSNEVDVAATPIKHLPAGVEAIVEDYRGKALGRAYVNPHSLICARLFSRSPEQALTKSFFKKRMGYAIALRERLFPAHSYRAVFGEADGLPGLIVDRFGDDLVIQTGTAGMDKVLPVIADALDALCQPNSITVRNESSSRALENLDTGTFALKGEVPACVSLVENGVHYQAPLEAGQKTGWFYDHRVARQKMMPLAAGARVLDVFSYCGGWGVLAAQQGADEVTCVDASEQALEYVHINARRNGVADRMRTVQADAFAAMKELIAAGERFDLVIVDPPAFIKRKKDFKNGLGGYHAINELAMRLVQPGGTLVSASCSMHLPREKLLDVVKVSAKHIDRFVQLFDSAGQAQDHPIHPFIPETDYLKSLFLRLSLPL